MVPVAKIPHFITVPPILWLWVQYTMISLVEKLPKNKNAPGGLIATLWGQILCTGIIPLLYAKTGSCKRLTTGRSLFIS